MWTFLVCPVTFFFCFWIQSRIQKCIHLSCLFSLLQSVIVPQYFVVRDLAPFKVLVSYSVQGLRAYHMPGTDNEMTTKAFHRNNSCPHWTYSLVGKVDTK